MIAKKPLPALQGGFTFLELIIVATIINVLAAIAIPAYQQYQDRTKLTEAFNLSKMARSQIADFYRQTGRLPIDNKMAGLPTAEKLNGKYVETLHVNNGVIVMTFRQSNDQLSGKVLSLHPRIVKDSPATPLAFQCGQAQEPLPEGIVVIGKNLTTVADNILPASCK